MGDTIYATLYATYNGVEHKSQTIPYSVTDYCYNMLERCSGDEYAEFRTVLVDLLNYGAAAQTYTGDTDELVNADLTEAQRAWGTSAVRELSSVKDPAYATVAEPKVEWAGVGLVLKDAVTMYVSVTAQSVEGLTLKITNGTDLAWEITSDEFVSENDRYYAYFNGLNAGQMSETVYLTFYEGETAVSNTACYSIESYAYDHQDDGDDLAALVKAMMCYGDSARVYAALAN